MHKMAITVRFNFIGATEAELVLASSDLLFHCSEMATKLHDRTADLTIILDSDSRYYYF